MGHTSNRRLRVIAAICLVGALVPLLWNRHGTGRPALPRTDRQSENPHRTDSAADHSPPNETLSTPQPAAPEPPPRQAAESSAAAPPPDYESEDFTHVPDWMPRPANAVSARAEHASLRSDGFLEGTLRYVFKENHGEVLDQITSHFESIGFRAEPGGILFSSDDPPRRVELRIETTPAGGIMVSLPYQGTDHEKSCRCHTCTGLPAPEP